jgi:hypothetical protein
MKPACAGWDVLWEGSLRRQACRAPGSLPGVASADASSRDFNRQAPRRDMEIALPLEIPSCLDWSNGVTIR